MKTNEGGRELLNQRCNNLSFKEEKAIAALSQLCQLANNRLDHYKAAKLMYLFDRDVLLNTGEPAFYGAYYALRLGLLSVRSITVSSHVIEMMLKFLLIGKGISH